MEAVQKNRRRTPGGTHNNEIPEGTGFRTLRALESVVSVSSTNSGMGRTVQRSTPNVSNAG